MQSRNRTRLEAGKANTGLYDLWLNSMLPTVGPSMVTGVISSSSHQSDDRGDGRPDRALRMSTAIDSERLAETLMQLGCAETASGAVEMRL